MENEIELWNEVIGYEGIYEISSFGRVKSLSRKIPHWRGGFLNSKEKIMSCFLSNTGYLTISFFTNNIKKNFLIHRLVAIAFIPNPDNLPEVNHKDGDKLNPLKSNLEWSTESENIIHAFKNNLKCSKGINNPVSKLTEIEVLEIRSKSVFTSRKILSQEYKVSIPCIRKIINRMSWTHI